MEPFSTAVSILCVSLGKNLGKETLISLFEDETSQTRSILEDGLKDSAGKLVQPLASALSALSLSRSVKREIEQNPTIFDLAGIAWGQALSERGDDFFAPLARSATKVVRALSPRWFVRALISISSPTESIRKEITGWESGARTLEISEAIALQITSEALDELELDIEPDTLILDMFRTAINELPTRIEKLFLAIPRVREMLASVATEVARRDAQAAREAAEETRKITQNLISLFDGTETAKQASTALTTIARATVEHLDRDVFGRKLSHHGEFALLPLRSTYVEPLGSINRSSEPIMGQILSALRAERNGIITILAPFGFGKSLTVKTLSARLADKWLQNPEASAFPLLMHGPEVLASHGKTPEEAVRIYLERVANIDSETSATIWRKANLILIFDSFDEVILSTNEARSWITALRQVAAGGRHQVIVASRDHALEYKWLRNNDHCIHITPFDRDRIAEWLEKTKGPVHDGSLSAEQIITWLGEDLAGTPILLLMAAWDWHSSEAPRSLSKGDLYSRFVSRISRGKWENVQDIHPVVKDGADELDGLQGEGTFERALARIAWTHFLKKEGRISDSHQHVLPVAEVESILRKEFRATDGSSLTDEQLKVVTKSIVLSVFMRKAEDDEGLSFAHKSFREFLTARHLVECLRTPQTGPHVHVGTIALAQSRLGDEEVSFTADLIKSLGELSRAKILEHLDKLILKPQYMLSKAAGDVEILTERFGDTVAFFGPQTAGKGRVLFLNAERLALALRNRICLLRKQMYFTPSYAVDGNFRIVNRHTVMTGANLDIAYECSSTYDGFVLLLPPSIYEAQGFKPFGGDDPGRKIGKRLALPLPPDFFSFGSTRVLSDIEIFNSTFADLLSLGQTMMESSNNGLAAACEQLFAWRVGDSWFVWPLVRNEKNANLLPCWRNLVKDWVSRARNEGGLSLRRLDPDNKQNVSALLDILTDGRVNELNFSDLIAGATTLIEELIESPEDADPSQMFSFEDQLTVETEDQQTVETRKDESPITGSGSPID